MNKISKEVTTDIKRFSNLVLRYIRNNCTKQKNEKLSRSQGIILSFIATKIKNGEPVYQKDIEQNFSIRRSTATESLKRLEKQGLIYRSVSDVDARLKDIHLTEKSLKDFNQVKSHLDEMASIISEGITNDELKTLSTIIKKMENNLKKQEQLA